MDILITFGCYYPSVGGAEEVCRRLAEAMVTRGHSVTVATSSDRRRAAPEHRGVRIESFDIVGNWVLGIAGDPAPYQALLRSGRFDVTFHYAAQIWTTDLALPLVGQLPAPAILAPCGYSGLDDARYARYFARLHEVLPGFAALVHHSEHYRDARYARDHGVPRCRVISNGVDMAEFDRATPGFRDRFELGDRPVVLNVSNHTGGKGHDRTIAAFCQVAPSDAVLAIVGNDSPDGCLADCRAAGDPRVLLLEDLPRADVVRAFRESDVFLFGSEVECAPLVILEAMAGGLPWVSTPVGNVDELPGGIVCESDELGDALLKLLEQPDRRAELGRRGRRAAEGRHDWEAILDAYERLFEDVAAERLRGDRVDGRILALDDERRIGLDDARRGDWANALVHFTASLLAEPAAPDTRLCVVAAMLRSASSVDVAELVDLVRDELEISPWAAVPNLVLFLLGGALGIELGDDLERAVSLGLPRQQLAEMAARGAASTPSELRAATLALLPG